MSNEQRVAIVGLGLGYPGASSPVEFSRANMTWLLGRPNVRGEDH